MKDKMQIVQTYLPPSKTPNKWGFYVELNLLSLSKRCGNAIKKTPMNKTNHRALFLITLPY